MADKLAEKGVMIDCALSFFSLTFLRSIISLRLCCVIKVIWIVSGEKSVASKCTSDIRTLRIILTDLDMKDMMLRPWLKLLKHLDYSTACWCR